MGSDAQQEMEKKLQQLSEKETQQLVDSFKVLYMIVVVTIFFLIGSLWKVYQGL